MIAVHTSHDQRAAAPCHTRIQAPFQCPLHDHTAADDRNRVR